MLLCLQWLLLSSSRVFKRAVISLLLISSSVSCNLRFFFVFFAMSLSMSVSFAKWLVSSPRILCSALSSPCISCNFNPSVCVCLFATSGSSKPESAVDVSKAPFNSPIVFVKLCSAVVLDKSWSVICYLAFTKSFRVLSKTSLACLGSGWVLLLYSGKFKYCRIACVPPDPTALLYSFTKELREKNVAEPCFAVILIYLSPTAQYRVSPSSDILNWL